MATLVLSVALPPGLYRYVRDHCAGSSQTLSSFGCKLFEAWAKEHSEQVAEKMKMNAARCRKCGYFTHSFLPSPPCAYCEGGKTELSVPAERPETQCKACGYPCQPKELEAGICTACVERDLKEGDV